MKRFVFRLATLLRIREAERDERRAQLADAFRVEAELQKQMTELEGELAAARRAHTADVGLVDVDRMLAAQRYGLVLEMDRRRLAEQQATVAQEVETRRAALVEADREVRVLERLRETQHDRWRAEAEKQQMKLLDEVASQRFLRQEV
jgi:flagellar export protein FliJ